MAGRNAQQDLSRFVEGPDHRQRASRDAPLDASRKDFWDDFSSLADQQQRHHAKTSSIGTSAMGMGKKGGAAQKPKVSDE